MVTSYAGIVIDMLINGYVLYRFAAAFMENKKGAFLAGVSYFVCMLLWYVIPFEVHNFAAYGIGGLTAFFVMCKTDQRNYYQKVYIAVTFFSLRWLSAYMSLTATKELCDMVIYTPYLIEHKKLQLFVDYHGDF